MVDLSVVAACPSKIFPFSDFWKGKWYNVTRLTFVWEEQRIAMMDIMILLALQLLLLLLLLPKTIQSSSFSQSYQRWDVSIMGRCHYSIHRRR